MNVHKIDDAGTMMIDTGTGRTVLHRGYYYEVLYTTIADDPDYKMVGDISNLANDREKDVPSIQDLARLILWARDCWFIFWFSDSGPVRTWALGNEAIENEQ